MKANVMGVTLSRRAHLLLVGSTFGVDPVMEGGQVTDGEKEVRRAARAAQPTGLLRRYVKYTL